MFIPAVCLGISLGIILWILTMLIFRTGQVLKTWMADKGSEDVETGQFSDEDLKGHWKSPH